MKSAIDDRLFVGRQLPNRSYVIKRRVASGLKGTVYEAESPGEYPAACKIVPVAKLAVGADGSPRWQEEILKANRVKSDRVVRIFESDRWTTPEFEVVFMLSEFVQGKTLRDMIDCKELDLGFVIGVVCDLLDFLRELRDQQIQHGDLHAKNIIIEDRSSSLVGPPFRVRVLDFGVAQATGQRQLLDDFDQLALMLREMLDTLELNSLSPTDRTLADFLRKVFLGKMLHEDNRALAGC